jgi:hypothetical protein
LSTSADPASAIVAALAGAGTRLVFGVPGGGPNLDVVGAAGAAGLRQLNKGSMHSEHYRGEVQGRR